MTEPRTEAGRKLARRWVGLDDDDEVLAAILAIEAEAAALDDPQWDNTEGAHPAWWRGCDYGYAKGKAAALDVERLKVALAAVVASPESLRRWRASPDAFHTTAALIAAEYARPGEPEA